MYLMQSDSECGIFMKSIQDGFIYTELYKMYIASKALYWKKQKKQKTNSVLVSEMDACNKIR